MEKRALLINVMVTDELYKKLSEEAEFEGMQIGDYVHHLISQRIPELADMVTKLTGQYTEETRKLGSEVTRLEAIIEEMEEETETE